MSAFVEALMAEIAELEAQLTSDPRYRKLRELKRVRKLYMDSAQLVPGLRAAGLDSRPFASGASAEVIKAAKEVLSGASGPTPTRIILDVLAARGVLVSGLKPLNSLSAILSKSNEFESHGRSGWTLAVPNGHETTTAGDDSLRGSPSPAASERRPDQPAEPPTEPRPGGGT